MAKVIIREVTIHAKTFDLRCEFDFSLVDGGSAETYTISISKPDFLFWKENNPEGTLTEYIRDQIRPYYEALVKQKELAVQMALLDKEITW